MTPVINGLVRLLLSTPDVTRLPRIVQLWDGLRILACSLYTLFVLAAGILAMGHGTVQQRWPARVDPRLALGFLASNLSLMVCHQTLVLANAVSRAVFGDGVSADDMAATLVGIVLSGNPDTAPLYATVFALALVVMGIALLATLMVRIAAVMVLVVCAPLLLACHGHPATENPARLWWRAFTGVMALQVLQSVVFLTCVKVLLDAGNYGFLGLPSSTALVNLIVLGAACSC
ncbi:hypothetical protein ACFQZC_08470 [Streptacidiphilus monticola]